ncbi:predicted protein [Postia placenta Mad-698-R]|nr:predicted protein [Postia placenta Mad-698-R]
MTTNIELAISSVLQRGLAISVSNVLLAYLRILGYAPPDATDVSVPHEAVVAFEHALDKEPRATASSNAFRPRAHLPEITQLRKDYWRERLAAPPAARCTCPSCGHVVSYRRDMPKESDDECEPISVPAPKKRVRRSSRGSCTVLPAAGIADRGRHCRESPGETGSGAPWGGVREGAAGSVRPVDEHMHLMTLCPISVARHTAPGDNYEAGGRPFRSLMC